MAQMHSAAGYSPAVPAGCWRLLDICVNMWRKDLCLGPVRMVRCFVTPSITQHKSTSTVKVTKRITQRQTLTYKELDYHNKNTK